MLCHIAKNERPGAVLVFMTGWDDINSLKDQLQNHPLLGDTSKILLLACHGSMASAEQVMLTSSTTRSNNKMDTPFSFLKYLYSLHFLI